MGVQTIAVDEKGHILPKWVGDFKIDFWPFSTYENERQYISITTIDAHYWAAFRRNVCSIIKMDIADPDKIKFINQTKEFLDNHHKEFSQNCDWFGHFKKNTATSPLDFKI